MSTINVNPFWTLVRSLESQITPQRTVGGTEVFFIVSVERPFSPNWRAGVTFEASRHHAAQRVAEGIHRLATEAEVAQYLLDQHQREERCRIEEERHKVGASVLKVDRAELLRLGELQK